MSKNGPGFRAANGSPIKHYSQRVLKGYGDHFQSLSMTAQVADVSTTLGSVNQMLKAGNRVHFETGNSYIEDVRTGRRTKIEEKQGTFEVGIWVPKSHKGCNLIQSRRNSNPVVCQAPSNQASSCNSIQSRRNSNPVVCQAPSNQPSSFQGQDDMQ